jgi:hypothetical protein
MIHKVLSPGVQDADEPSICTWSMTLVSCEECSPGCPWEWLSDDYCDAACNVPACNYDGGDCEECSPGCPIVWLGDGICDAACNVAACNFDNGDCQ